MKTFLAIIGALFAAALLLVAGLAVLGAVTGPHTSGHLSSLDSSVTPTPSLTLRPPVDVQRLNPNSYSEIGVRDYALLMKDPDAHIGEKIIMYGAVEQFDSSTGNSELRATTMAEPHPPTDDDEYNSLIEASDPSILADVLKGDFARMYVVVDGTESYTSTLGADLTVPKFKANIVTVLSSRH